jgi:integrase
VTAPPVLASQGTEAGLSVPGQSEHPFRGNPIARGAATRASWQPGLERLQAQFPARPGAAAREVTQLSRAQLLARVLAPPFAFADARYQAHAARGVRRVVDWLQALPGASWQERWTASGAEQHPDWRQLAAGPGWLARQGEAGRYKGDECSAGLTVLICADVIRPAMSWLLLAPAPKNLAAAMTRTRDPVAFSKLAAACDELATGRRGRHVALARIAMIMAAKGGLVADITVGDCIEMMQAAGEVSRAAQLGRGFASPLFYQLLRSLQIFPPAAPATSRAFAVAGQMSVDQLIDRYGIECRPVRDLLVGYLHQFQVRSDYTTLEQMSYVLGKLFWRDLELHHAGISSLHLPAGASSAWKQRLQTRTIRTAGPDGRVTESQAPRISATQHLGAVRTFYLDIAQWAADDPSRWGPWVAPCPVRDGELDHKKQATRRKSRMDQRTRERLPVLPALAAAAEAQRDGAAARLAAARAASPGQEFTAGGQTLIRPSLASEAGSRTWADDPATGRRRDLQAEDRRAFWAWASVEVLRLTGVRIEELSELSHHSLIQYRLPATGELVPLLQIAPSKTDTERLLVISPELADVLSAIITRIRGADGSVPLVVAYDYGEKTWNPPMPLLFQWRCGPENRRLSPAAIRKFLNLTLAAVGLTGPAGLPLRFTPHDFRRLFLTDAVMHGMPPHIAQLVAGHRDINVTMGYKAVYPEEVINGHRAFIARRRALRPGEEYRTPNDAEWEEFLGHFQRRKVALGECGRAYSTSCLHEHSCLRCPLLRPSPAQRHRITEIIQNLTDRIDEAEREGWAGEAEGLKISLDAARQKLAQLDQAARRAATVHLGMPAFPDIAGRTING